MAFGSFYSFCIVLGLGYGIVSAIMSWLGGGGDGDVHVDAAGHLDAGHISPVSGPVIATFVTGFGAGGILGVKGMELSPGPAVLVAAAAGFLMAGLVFGVLSLLLAHTQAGSQYATEDLDGRHAEVITAIPAGGTGEIAYVVKGQRERAAARIGSGEAIAKGSHVVIEQMVGSIAHVRFPD